MLRHGRAALPAAVLRVARAGRGVQPSRRISVRRSAIGSPGGRARECGGGRRVTIGPAEGSFPGFPEKRRYEVRLHDVWPPREVRIDGEPLAKAPSGDGWSYDERELSLVIRTPPRSANQAVRLDIAPES